MEIKTLNDILRLLKHENPSIIDAVDCQVSIFELANHDSLEAVERVISTIERAAELEKKYCIADPDRKSKQNPHKAISVLIRSINPPDDFPGYEKAMNNLFFSLEILCRAAEKQGIWLLVENVSKKLLISPLELRDLIDSLSCPWLGVYFNDNNLNNGFDVSDYIGILGKRIIKFQ